MPVSKRHPFLSSCLLVILSPPLTVVYTARGHNFAYKMSKFLISLSSTDDRPFFTCLLILLLLALIKQTNIISLLTHLHLPCKVSSFHCESKLSVNGCYRRKNCDFYSPPASNPFIAAFFGTNSHIFLPLFYANFTVPFHTSGSGYSSYKIHHSFFAFGGSLVGQIQVCREDLRTRSQTNIL